MNALWALLAELIYPARANCLGCGSPLGADGEWLCAECEALLRPLAVRGLERCPRCDMPLLEKEFCASCASWPADSLQCARCAFSHKRPVRRLIARLKYDSVRGLAGFLGRRLSDMLIYRAIGEFDLIVPVPMHPRRLRQRGFNHAQALAEEVARHSGMEIRLALSRVRDTPRQARLSAQKRRLNLEGAFRVEGDVLGLRVLLVDDVLTSGNTAVQCALALRKAGAQSVVLIAVSGSMR